MPKAVDLTGLNFHCLTVLCRAENTKQGKAQWLCQCVCGAQKVIPARNLTSKKNPVKSCGCMRSHLIAEARTQHGMSHHPAFAVWHSMKQRCQNPNHHAYHNYGGRGIMVCKEWSESFEAFWRDMGPTYRHGMDLDRINNNEGYRPGNCRWTTRKINTRNKRTNRVIDTPYGRMTVSTLAELTGIGETTLIYRLDHGWPIEFLCMKPDYRNRSTTSGIAVRGTDSLFGTEGPEKSVS